jgi:hypothetical protein
MTTSTFTKFYVSNTYIDLGAVKNVPHGRDNLPDIIPQLGLKNQTPLLIAP